MGAFVIVYNTPDLLDRELGIGKFHEIRVDSAQAEALLKLSISFSNSQLEQNATSAMVAGLVKKVAELEAIDPFIKNNNNNELRYPGETDGRD